MFKNIREGRGNDIDADQLPSTASTFNKGIFGVVRRVNHAHAGVEIIDDAHQTAEDLSKEKKFRENP